MSLKNIQLAVCDEFGITIEELLGEQRIAKFSRPRHIAMYLALRRSRMSLMGISRAFRRDRSTVRSAVYKVDKRLTEYQDDINAVLCRLNSPFLPTLLIAYPKVTVRWIAPPSRRIPPSVYKQVRVR